MFDLFKNRPRDVKEIRSAILQFIKDQLQKAEGGEGSNIRGLYLYIQCAETERHLYESAVFYDSPDRFKNDEIQKIADDYALSLPTGWMLKISFEDDVPVEATRAKGMDVALLISTYKNPVLHKQTTAYLDVLVGVAEKKRYTLTSATGKYNIGRGAGVQTPEGFFRKNTIAFVDTDNDPINRAVSRQHAHIDWNAETRSFFLFADNGGIPPNNKIKVRSVGGMPVKLLTTEIGHRLQEGDQVILGDAALVEFTFLPA